MTSYKELPLLAQLNCNADARANRFPIGNPNINHAMVHQFPEGGCSLQLPQGTIPQPKTWMCRSLKPPSPWGLNCRKFGWWHSNVFDMVDYNAHSQAIKQHRKHTPTFVKYIHKILPNQKTNLPIWPKISPNCLSCQAPVEDMDHFWKCHATNCCWFALALVPWITNLGPMLRELSWQWWSSLATNGSPLRFTQCSQCRQRT